MPDPSIPAATPAAPQGPAPTAAPSAPQGDLTVRGAVDQLMKERKQEPARATPGAAPAPHEGPDPADLAALDAIEPAPLQGEQPSEQPRYRLPDGSEATPDEVAEWKRGTLRQQDYTRKTQELAQHRNALVQQAQTFQQQMAAFHQNQGAYAQAIDNAIAVVQHYVPQPPSDELRKSDFYTWQEQKAEYDSRMGQLQNLHGERQYLQQVEQQKQQAAFTHHIQRQQHALLTVKPELRDPAKAMKFSQDFTGWAVRNGFAAHEAKSVQDARLLVQLEKAMKWDRLQEQKAKLSEKAKDAQPMQSVQTPSRRYSQAERDNQSVSSLRKSFEDKAQSGSMASIREAADLLTAERKAAARRR